MQSTGRRIFKAVGITVTVIILLELLLSIGLVYFAIGSFDGMESIPDAPKKLTEEARVITEHNIAELSAKTEKWMNETDIPEVSITAADGAVLYADMVTPVNGHRWVILLHGYKRTRERVRNYARFYAEQGFGIIMPDLRGHGKSGGAFIGMGWLDRDDIIKWTEFIISNDPDAEIVMHGVSMGASAAMMTSGETLAPNVKAVIADCGYSSVWEEFSDVMKSYTGLPEFPLMYTASFFAKLLAGYSYDEASALEQVKKSNLPTLFIHGKADTFVNPDMAERLFKAHPDGELFFVEEAGHGQSLYYDPDTYFEKVFAFTDRYFD